MREGEDVSQHLLLCGQYDWQIAFIFQLMLPFYHHSLYCSVLIVSTFMCTSHKLLFFILMYSVFNDIFMANKSSKF